MGQSLATILFNIYIYIYILMWILINSLLDSFSSYILYACKILIKSIIKAMSSIGCLYFNFYNLKLWIKNKFINHIINSIQLAKKFSCIKSIKNLQILWILLIHWNKCICHYLMVWHKCYISMKWKPKWEECYTMCHLAKPHTFSHEVSHIYIYIYIDVGINNICPIHWIWLLQLCIEVSLM